MSERAGAPPANAGSGVAARLTDGTPVLFRLAAPGDGPRILTGFERCSIETRYFRFLSGGYQLTDERLSALTDADQVDHVVWLALDAGAPSMPVIAVARFARSAERPHAAEVAFIVADEYQGRGAGGLLFEALRVSAETRRVTTFEAQVLAENVAMKALLLRRGARITGRSGPEVTLELAVDETGQSSGNGAFVHALRVAAGDMSAGGNQVVVRPGPGSLAGSTVLGSGD